MKKELKLKRATDAAKRYFNLVLVKRYGSGIAKKAFYRIALNQSKKEILLKKKEQLEKELKEVKGRI